MKTCRDGAADVMTLLEKHRRESLHILCEFFVDIGEVGYPYSACKGKRTGEEANRSVLQEHMSTEGDYTVFIVLLVYIFVSLSILSVPRLQIENLVCLVFTGLVNRYMHRKRVPRGKKIRFSPSSLNSASVVVK